MERRWMSGLLATLVFVQGMSFAQAQDAIIDLPNPFGVGGLLQQPAPQLLAPLLLPESVQAQFIGTVEATSIPRKLGGTLLRVNLSPALSLLRLEVSVLKNQLKIYDSTLITSTGQRIAIREFKDTGVLQNQSVLVSENLNLTDSIAAIELRAESFQAESDIELKAISGAGVPRMSLQPAEVVQVVPPSQPIVKPIQPTQPAQVRPLPPPQVQPAPLVPDSPRTSGCLEDLCVGDRAYNLKTNFSEVQIVGIERGTFVLFFVASGKQGGGWTRADLAKARGCNGSICVGTRAINISSNNRRANVIGVQTDGRFVVFFEDNGGVGGNWSQKDLALLTGCSGQICVGTEAYNIQKDYRKVTVVAVQADGKFVVFFQDIGGFDANLTQKDLALITGCAGKICVGTEAYNIQRDYRKVRVVAVQADGKLVVFFQDIGGIGGNWSQADLALTTGCGRSFCVGNEVVVKNNSRKARIVGIQMNGRYVLSFLQDGKLVGDLSDGDLARAR